MPKKEQLTREGKRVATAATMRLKKRKESHKEKANQTIRKSISQNEKRELLKKTNWSCHVCGRRIGKAENVDIDHIRQRVHGGQDEEGNYVASCKRCNSLRGRLHHSEIQEALAFGKWAMQEIHKQTGIGIKLANLYGRKWVAQQAFNRAKTSKKPK